MGPEFPFLSSPRDKLFCKGDYKCTYSSIFVSNLVVYRT